jgi:hypothetical protein
MTPHTRIHFSGPIDRPGWQRRLYPVAEALTYLGVIAAIILVGALCSVRG